MSPRLSMHVCWDVCLRISTHVSFSMCTWAQVYAYIKCVYARMFVYMHRCVHAHFCTREYTSGCVQAVFCVCTRVFKGVQANPFHADP